MPKFSYIARTKEGRRESGVIEASSQDDLVLLLQAKGLIINKIAPLEASGSFKDMGANLLHAKFTHQGVKIYDLVFFARQLATLLESGVTLYKSLDALLRQIDSVSFYKIISRVRSDVGAGLPLKEALARHPKVFTDMWINIVESGEASGNLALVLDRLASYLEMQAGFSQKIISALIYPGILFCVSIGAVAFFVIKIVPTFSDLFKGMGAKIPPVTLFLVQLSEIAKKGFFPLIIGIGLFYFIFQQFYSTSSGRRTIDSLKLKIPIFGNFFKILAVERFVSQMATLIEGGVPILYALEITERSGGNKLLEEAVRNIKNKVREGRPLGELLAASNFFEPMVVQMVSIGEEVGELSKMFRRVADFYANYLETFIGRFTTIFEPIMLVFMGGVIGFMLVALFLPIFSIAKIGSSGG